MIYYGNGIIEFDHTYNSSIVQIYYNGNAMFYGKHNAYDIKKYRQRLLITPLREITSTHIIKYFGEFKPYKAINLNNKSLVTLKAIGLSYWQYADSKWEDDTIKWEDDNATYTHIKKLGKNKNIRFRGY